MTLWSTTHRRAITRLAHVAAAATAAALLTAAPASAGIDDSPPQLATLEISPRAIDVSAEDAVVTTTLSITTGDHGFARGRLVWVGPGGQSVVVPFDRDEQVPGPTWDETFAVPTTFVRGTQAGAWRLDSVSLWNTLDVEGLVDQWWLDYLGHDTALAVTSSPAPVPPAPVAVRATAGDGSARVTWFPGAPDPAGAVTGYRVTASPGGASAQTGLAGYPPVAATTVDVPGLTNGVRYTFTVVALSASGVSPASAPSRPVAPRPEVTAAGSVEIEGDAEDGPRIPFTVRLSSPSTVPVEVDVMTTGGSATPGQDYVITGSRVTVPPGLVEVAAPAVRVVGDDLHEVRETLRLRLSGPLNAVVRQSADAVATILDDDPLPVLSVADARVVEGDRADTELVFQVRLSEISGAPASVAWETVRSGTAQAGTDYLAASGRVTVPAGSLTATIRVRVRADRVDEPDERVLLRLAGARQALLDRAGVVGTIVDDDPAPA